MRTRNLASLCFALVLGAGCTKDRKDGSATEPSVGAPGGALGTGNPHAPGDVPMAPMAPMAKTAPGSPHGGAAPAAPAPAAGGALSGKVTETMDAGGYTYAKLTSDSGEVWVAGPQTKLMVGDMIAGLDGQLMPGFHSNTLNRTFDQIYFVSGYVPAGSNAPLPGGAPSDPHAGMTTNNPHAGMPGAPAAEPAAPAAPMEKIAPAAGGQTIAAVFADKAKLAGKAVVVRGKVVKFNAGILDHNWIHLQDGTGAAGSNDLLVTTAATDAPVNVGDVIVARGTIALDKDFGAGYSYAVLVENATVSAK